MSVPSVIIDPLTTTWGEGSMRNETFEEIVARNIAQSFPAAKLITKGEWVGMLEVARFSMKKDR